MPNQRPVVRGPVCTFGFRRRRSDGVDPVVWRDGAASSTVAPLALTSYVVASLVHLSGAPRLKCSMTLLLSNSLTKIFKDFLFHRSIIASDLSSHLMLRKVSRDPGTAGVHHAIKLEWEDAGLVC